MALFITFSFISSCYFLINFIFALSNLPLLFHFVYGHFYESANAVLLLLFFLSCRSKSTSFGPFRMVFSNIFFLFHAWIVRWVILTAFYMCLEWMHSIRLIRILPNSWELLWCFYVVRIQQFCFSYTCFLHLYCINTIT